MKGPNFLRHTAVAALAIFALGACTESVNAPSSVQTTAAFDHGKDRGNYAPNGAHYNLNIIGIWQDDRQMPDNSGGHVIFVKLGGEQGKKGNKGVQTTDIELIPGDEFLVLDKDGTDGEAAFQLPADVSSTYEVYARPLGKPGGSASLTTCAEEDGIEYCSLNSYVTMRTRGKQKFVDVTDELLTVSLLLDPDIPEEFAILECLGENPVDTPDFDDPSIPVTVDLFNPCFEGYFWRYDNNGLRLLQLRFYPV